MARKTTSKRRFTKVFGAFSSAGQAEEKARAVRRTYGKDAKVTIKKFKRKTGDTRHAVVAVSSCDM